MTIKSADVKLLYVMLQVRMPELPANSRHFRGFITEQLNKACQNLKINGFLLDCEITADGFEEHPGCLAWRSNFVEGGTY